MAGPTVVVSVLADSANMRKGFADINDSAGKVGSGLSTLAKIGGAALLAVGAAVAGVVASSIKAAAEAQVIAAQTTAVLASTANSANKTADEIANLAGTLSKMSGVDDEVIQAGENILLTFTKIQGVQFDGATKAALNLSVALGKDLNSSATLVGKALNDPIGGLSALSKAGIQFTDDQKAVISSLVEIGDVAGAQNIILAELEKQFGGSAEAFGNTFEGALGKVKTSLGNLQETIGSAFLPPLTAVLNTVAGILNTVGESETFTAVVTTIGEFVTQLLSGGEAAGTFGDAFKVVMAFLNPFGLVLQAVAPLLPQLAESFKLLATALGGALVQILPVLVGLIETLVGALSGVFASVLPVVIGLITQLAGIFTRLLPVILPVVEILAGILTDTLDRLVPIITLVAEVIGAILGAALTAIEPLITVLVEVLGTVLTALGPVIDAALSIVEAFLPLLPVLGDLIGALLPPLIELLLAVLEPILGLIAPLLDLLVPALNLVGDVLGFLIGIIAAVIGAFVGLITGSEETTAQVAAIWEGIVAFFEGIPTAIASFFSDAGTFLTQVGVDIVTGLLNGLKSAIGTVTKWVEDAAAGIADTFKDVLGIASPSKVFKEFGKFTVQGLAIGLKDFSSVTNAARDLGNAVTDGFEPNLTLSGSGSSGYGGGLTINVNGGLATSAEIGRAIVEAIEEYERLNGKR